MNKGFDHLKPVFFDSHAHISSELIKENPENLLLRAEEARVKKILNICTDKKSLEKGLELSGKFPWVYNAGATTPHDVEKEGLLYFDLFASAAREKKLKAVGETGLDYYYEHAERKIQQEFFLRYLNLAQETGLPVVIHCREAFEDLFAISKPFEKVSFLLHCFTGSWEEAKRAIDRNWMVSFSGIVTFKKSEALQEVARKMPLKHMLIETDSPYLAPIPFRGKPNEPAYVVHTAQFLADLKNLPLHEIAAKTYTNSCKFLSVEE